MVAAAGNFMLGLAGEHPVFCSPLFDCDRMKKQ
jgi:hypothetical protein